MRGDGHQDLQDFFLNHVRKNKVPITVFLVNGIKLQGIVSWFDNFCVLIKKDGHMQMLYKHAISTISPNKAIDLFQDSEEDAQKENKTETQE